MLYEVYYSTSVILLPTNQKTSVWVKTQNKQIYLLKNSVWVPFTIMGVNLGTSMPGKTVTDFGIPYETYMEWLRLISEMNANVVRVYTIQSPDFYKAFYDYNIEQAEPLYLLQGVWADYDVMRAGRDALDNAYIDVFFEDCRKAVDIIHGRRTIQKNDIYAYGLYRYDISPWVLGYILGTEWGQEIVLYTNDIRKAEAGYAGQYLYTAPGASAFETMLTRVGDTLLSYETTKYGQQRLVAFSNWAGTDPIYHQQWRELESSSPARIDVENIHQTKAVLSGMFASYHIYPFYHLYFGFEPQYAEYIDEEGANNPYLAYLLDINEHHTIPVVISEFGLPSSRGISQLDNARGMNQGALSEQEQAERLPVLLNDVMNAGCSGAILFEWQDEWSKRAWNTWPNVEPDRGAYWSDYQSSAQFFGMITFDPGEKESICYIDGDPTEWEKVEIVAQCDGLSLQVLYDEKFIYFHIQANSFHTETDRFFIPIHLTDQSGAYRSEDYDLSFDRPVNFLLVIDGESHSCLLVQEYYDSLYATARREIWETEAYPYPPVKESPLFRQIEQFLRGRIYIDEGVSTEPLLHLTGNLEYGNANPRAIGYNSLADFIFYDAGVEIRIPYRLLNFGDPSTMRIHDDYYKHFGVVYKEIDRMDVQLFHENQETLQRTATPFGTVKMVGWYDNPSFHTRKKAAYFTMQEAFAPYSRRED